jgi:predicted dehydrogenase
MIRDWGNWCWLSGDHIVEQHIHNIDAALWFTGVMPAKAVGVGSRQRRVTGDQFDNFSIDYELTDGRHMMSMCRQIEGCANFVGEVFVGTKGSMQSSNRFANTIYKKNGDIAWQWDQEENPPKDQEHVTLVNSIRTGEPVNYAELTALSTLTAIQGREAAYTGKEIVFDELMDSDMELGPPRDNRGRIVAMPTVPVAGVEGKARG